MGNDVEHWKRVIFPMLTSVVGATIGITELHCACVAKGGDGVLLAGRSHSGKSTLALALACLGFDFLSDDRTCCTLRKGKLRAWSLPTDLKLRTEAAAWFPELQPSGKLQEDELHFAPETLRGIRRARVCTPRWLLFLEPTSSGTFSLERIAPEEAACRLRQDLLAETADARQHEAELMDGLTSLPCGILRYSEDPWFVANKISACLAEMESIIGKKPAAEAGRRVMSGNRSGVVDPLGRFTRTEQQTVLPVMGRNIRFETNSESLLRRVQQLFSIYPACSDEAQFRWRIIQNPPSPSGTGGFRRSAFSDGHLRFAQVGRRNFYALDLRLRTAVGWVAEELAHDEVRLTIPYLDSLFCMTAASLGLVSLHANCVAHNGKGAIILGHAGDGKTTASYLAAREPMHFHADEGLFLELHRGSVQAWAGFWPAVFREESGVFFPELKARARQFTYGELSYYHLDKSCLQRNGRPVLPAYSIFLRRAPGSGVKLVQIAPDNAYDRLTSSVLFEEEEQFRQQEAVVLKALAALPCYELSYGGDPAAAAEIIQELLNRSPRPEQPLSPSLLAPA